MYADSRIYDSERLKWKLMAEYKDRKLEELIEGEENGNDEGTFFLLKNEFDMDMELPDAKISEDVIKSDFQLISGIGTKTEEKLNNDGYADMSQLYDDEKYCSRIEPILNELEERNLISLQKRIERWHSRNHTCCYHLMGYTEPEDILFFDIETMGLKYRPLFLIGVGSFNDGKYLIKQYFARNLNEERAVIKAFLDELNKHRYLASFNGRSFDSRFIKERMELHGLRGDLDLPHFDILHMSRNIWDVPLPNHKLTTLEKHLLNIERENDVSSAMVPHFYKIYLEKKNPGPVLPILEHNKQDIFTLVLLLNELGRLHGRSASEQP
ncbi:MAG: ribonuclease H-like domain-containing protein [Thermoplasmata archaeon]